MEGDEFGVPAGWYPDPLGLPQLRWWDSQAWTEFTSEARAPMIVQPASTVSGAAGVAGSGIDDAYGATTRTATYEEQLPSRREQREREREERDRGDEPLADAPSDSEEYSFGDLRRAADGGQRFTASELFADPLIDPAAPEVEPSPSHEEVGAQPLLTTTLRELEAPVADTVDTSEASPRSATAHANSMPLASALDAIELEEAAPERELHTKRTYTASSWMIAFLWLIQLAAAAVAIFVVNEGHNLALIWMIWVGTYFVSVGIASYDRLVLQTWGHRRPASAWWALLSPVVYLVMRLVRTFRETGKGFGLLVGWAISAVVVLAANALVPAFLIASLPQTFADEAAASVERTAASLGAEIDVTCPATAVPLVEGQSFTCAAVKTDGESDSVLVTLVRQNGWVAWQVDDWGSWVLAD